MIQTISKFEYKAASVILLLSLLLFSCNKQIPEPYRQVVFSKGLPETLQPFEKDLPFKNFTYAALDTGTDTLRVFLGRMAQGTHSGYWVGIASNGEPAHFSSVSLEELDTLDYRSKDIEIEFNDDRNSIALRVIEVDSLTLKYSWMDNLELSQNIALKSVEKPLRIHSQFPEMNLETLDGEHFSSSEFEDQFVVINWWATWCAPCIKEIPGLNEIVDRYSNKEKVRFIAITNEPKDKINSFLKSKNFNYEMTFANSEVQNLFGNAFPVNLIVDPMGTITYLREGAGPGTPSEIEASLRQQLEISKSGEIVMTE